MDFHCHLDLYPDARNLYAEAVRRQFFIWLVTTSPKAYEATSRVLPQTGTIRISPGIHPEIVEQKAAELPLLLEQIGQCELVGEVGLDGSHRYKAQFAVQQRVFKATVKKCVEVGGRALSIHSRLAAREVLDVLEENPGFGTAVLHWFTDSSTQLTRAAKLGCWFSVGPAMFSSANGRKLAGEMPRERVVAESDGPFAKVGGVPVHPWEALDAAIGLAQAWNVSVDDAHSQLISNGQQLVSEISKLRSNDWSNDPIGIQL
jgi:TatD DNase family protein